MRSPRRAWATLVLLLVGCAGTPTPDWRLDAKSSLDRALAAQLAGNDRVAAFEFDRARGEIARSGRIDLMARAELLRCAAQLASLQFGRCAGFEPLRDDAPAAEQAYADFLGGMLTDPARIALLPPAQRPIAAPGAGAAADLEQLQALADPLSRLVAAATWLRAGRATPPMVALAVDTASAQGWRRPLLAWLQVQRRLAETAGDRVQADRLQRRIELVLAGPPTP